MAKLSGKQYDLTGGLDLFGSSQGSIVIRGASAWTVLGPGSSGQMLQSNGAGANPSWVTPALGGSTSYGSNAPAMDGTASAGSASSASRSDHVHPTDTSRAPLAGPAFTGTATFANRPTFAGATPYDSGNLTQTAVNGIIGYVPARPSTSFGGSIGGSASTGVNSGFAKVASVSFTATAANLYAEASFYVANGGSSASSYAAYVRAVDTTANQVVVTGGTDADYAAAGAGCKLVPVAFSAAGAVTPGNSITVELWVTSTTGTAGTAQNFSVGGANY